MFAEGLWSEILSAWTPRVILTIDCKTFEKLKKILLGRGEARVARRMELPTGWGNTEMEAMRILVPGHEEAVTLARLPHLARFRLMGKEECWKPVREFLDYVYASTRNATCATESSQCVGMRGPDLCSRWVKDIPFPEARAAFRLLVDISWWTPHLALNFQPNRSRLKACRLYDCSDRQPYSFTLNKKWLLFDFRLPEVRRDRDRWEREFESFSVNNKREWTVRLRNEADVWRLVGRVDEFDCNRRLVR